MLTGCAPVEEFLAHAATMTTFETEAVSLPEAHVLQATFEIRIGGRCSSLPPGLHPTNPPTFIAQVWRCPSSPWGPFLLAQGRIGARSGLRPRGFVQSAVCDNPEAAAMVAAQVGIAADDVVSGVLPEGKVATIRDFRHARYVIEGAELQTLGAGH